CTRDGIYYDYDVGNPGFAYW
nr:immunoglobulin heavy chain junction region [Mus musculus]